MLTDSNTAINCCTGIPDGGRLFSLLAVPFEKPQTAFVELALLLYNEVSFEALEAVSAALQVLVR